MYAVIDQRNGESVDSKWDDFDDALARSEELAEELADDSNDDISSYENGSDPRNGPGQWEAGACPVGDDGAYWPHVEWVD